MVSTSLSIREFWELQDRIFNMWEWKEVKGQRSKKPKLDPQVEMKSKSRKSDLIIEELPEDMKLLPRWSLQGIKDGKVISICTFTSSRQGV